MEPADVSIFDSPNALRRARIVPADFGAGVFDLPIGGDIWTYTPSTGVRPAARVVRTGYFRAMQLSLALGRDFTERDNEQSAAVAGREPSRKAHRAEVVKNARQSDWTSEPGDELYLPYL